ncbi:ABC transporter ATP-binding protein [Streptomyces rugosispiralis]|uniref:ATP-binding cassette domain-containing protein n=1 Tax=Streptomyces rugosispiralis TaxID=2967341 RepID=A0ABT1V8Z8_9ACTN|nr:ATP-binding cassette domain-containing protein [Streptomyces rugosispiralis]MCQ8193857.1 ATP-binding cassette domain-containing protein [Streptomyces rugosispiralis]
MTAEGTALLEASGLTVCRAEDGSVLLDGVDLRVGPGEVLAITGASGAGKSTLLHALLDTLPAGLRRSAGTVRRRGGVVQPGADGRRWRRARCGYVGQDPAVALHPRWRVERIVGEELTGPRAERAQRVRQALELLGLDEEFARRRARELSGGQAQRVVLARALAAGPDILLLDEPTSAMDRDTARRVIEAVRARRGVPELCTVLVTHDPTLVRELADQVLRLSSPATPPLPPRALGPRVGERRSGALGAVLATRGLRVVRPDGAVLLEGADLDLVPGELTTVLGPSGSGKTSLLHALAGRRPATGGQVRLRGRALAPQAHHRRRDELRAVQLVGQHPAGELNPAHRIGRAVARPLRVLHGLDARGSAVAAAELLAAVGLTADLAGHRPHRLSGGQRQRVALARALAARPDVLLLDEPTSALDAASARVVLDLLDRLRAEGMAVLAVTHDPAVARRADQVLHLRGGWLVPHGPVDPLPTVTGRTS